MAIDTTWRIPLVGGTVEIVLYDVEPELARAIHDDVVREAQRLQRIFNLYDPASELNALNAQRTWSASPELTRVLALALTYCEKTDGAYDITRGKQFLERKSGKCEVTPIGCTYRDVRLVPRGNCSLVTLTHPDCLIDLGSIAKGYIADALLDYLGELGVESAFIDARGDMAIRGAHLEVINIQHPLHEGTVRPFALENAAVATSGGYRQYAGTPAMSHLLGETAARSVTVLAPTLAEADVLATALYLVSAGRAAEILPAHASAFIITEEAEIALNGFPPSLAEVTRV